MFTCAGATRAGASGAQTRQESHLRPRGDLLTQPGAVTREWLLGQTPAEEQEWGVGACPGEGERYRCLCCHKGLGEEQETKQEEAQSPDGREEAPGDGLNLPLQSRPRNGLTLRSQEGMDDRHLGSGLTAGSFLSARSNDRGHPSGHRTWPHPQYFWPAATSLSASRLRHANPPPSSQKL